MSDPTRGITCSDMRRVVRAALHNGWQWGGFTGTTHAKLIWPKTHELVTFGLTPSVASWKSVATDIKRVSGVEVWHKGNRKRSRKADQLTGFSLDAARRECKSWHGDHDEDVDALRAQHDELIERCRELAARRHQLREIPPLLKRIACIEKRLRALSQPIDEFDPFTLNGDVA